MKTKQTNRQTVVATWFAENDGTYPCKINRDGWEYEGTATAVKVGDEYHVTANYMDDDKPEIVKVVIKESDLTKEITGEAWRGACGWTVEWSEVDGKFNYASGEFYLDKERNAFIHSTFNEVGVDDATVIGRCE